MKDRVTVFWFRRDLRLHDNTGLYHALRSGKRVLPVFIFDRAILDGLEERADGRVQFIHATLLDLQRQLRQLGSSMYVLHGYVDECMEKIGERFEVDAVYANADYEPYARDRDARVEKILGEKGVPLLLFKDQVIFEKDEAVKDNGEPYTVFTPYSRKWKERLAAAPVAAVPSEKLKEHFLKMAPVDIPALAGIGFKESLLAVAPPVLDEQVAAGYDRTRDLPGIAGTTRLGVHLRFGTVGIRSLAARVAQLNDTLLNELIWREFFQMILWHFPRVVNESFRKEYDQIVWRNNEGEFERWCSGQTGYPIVDAGMRELNATGFMHNRVRMITASFLTKHLLTDWRWGEAYFAGKLMDYDLAANNGNWQWAAGCGCDAAPYFRVFNPYIQAEKFDKDGIYVRRWVPEAGSASYIAPIIDHKVARDRCLAVYKKALSGS